MKKMLLVALLATPILFFNCENENTNFKITKDAIGQITKDTKVSDLETLFATDSIVAENGVPNINLGFNLKDEEAKTENESVLNDNLVYDKIEVFEKGGLQLLSLTPTKDSIPKIENIRIYDPRYKTDKGLTINSTFKDITEKYTIKKIITSMNNVVILIKENGLYFTIDKKELPESLRYDSNLNIEAVQIPDAAKIKYMMLAWE
jgi:hypothetical protein